MTHSIPSGIDWTQAGAWYDLNAEAFEMATLELKPSALLQDFARALPRGSRVLDAGCGAGRDSRWLLDEGFSVDAFDVSKEMVTATRANTGGCIEPRRLDFRDFRDPAGSWQGIWAMASLLHLPREDVQQVLPRLLESLTEDGILFFSLKHGEGEKVDELGRPTSYFEIAEIAEMVFCAMPGPARVETRLQVAPNSRGHKTPWIDVRIHRSRSC